MKIDAVKLGLATLFVFAVFWIVCSALVIMMPAPMMQMSGHMVHADFGHMNWQLNWTGFFYGLVAWSISAGAAAWAVATVYNRLIS